MIVVNKRCRQWTGLKSNARRIGYILERSVALIVKEQDTIAGCDCEIGVAIVVVVGGGACDCVKLGIEAGFWRNLLELPPAGIVKQRHSSLWATIGKQ